MLRTPSHRHDLLIEEDIVEEIIRIYGYDNIIEREIEKPMEDLRVYQSTRDALANALVYDGFFGIMTFSFIDERTALMFAKDNEVIRLLKPLNKDLSVMRPSIIASHLKSIKNNQNKSQKNNMFFEMSKRFFLTDGNINEEDVLTAIRSEKIFDKNWRFAQREVSVYDIKGDLEKILAISNVNNYEVKSEAPEYFHPGRRGAIVLKNEVIAYFGEIHPSILASMEINGPVVAFEIKLDMLPDSIVNKVKDPIKLSQYQPVSRDFSFILDKSIDSSRIVESIIQAGGGLIRKVNIFDVYESEPIGKDKKAIAVEVLIEPQDLTLNEEQIASISASIIDAVAQNCSGVLRDF
jgi:phenylalanyl-tRNA synthetase beta chain